MLEARPDIVGHVNGGTTALPDADIEQLVASGMAIEIVHCGNGRAALHAIGLARETGALGRVILGHDAPSGSGVVPLGILRTMAHLASLCGITPERPCLATGNTARDPSPRDGTIAVGREGPHARRRAAGVRGRHGARRLAIGDLPGVGMILIDGKPVVGRSRNTPPASRAPEVVKGPGVGGGGH